MPAREGGGGRSRGALNTKYAIVHSDPKSMTKVT